MLNSTVVEIVEANKAKTVDLTDGYIKPDQVYINGVPIVIPGDSEVKVGGYWNEDEALTVTLTMFVRRLVISHKDER